METIEETIHSLTDLNTITSFKSYATDRVNSLSLTDPITIFNYKSYTIDKVNFNLNRSLDSEQISLDY